MHFRSLRIVIWDYRKLVNQQWATASTRRTLPAALFPLKTRMLKHLKPNEETAFGNQFTKSHQDEQLFAYDKSKLSFIRAITKNWIGMTFGQIKNARTNKLLNNDQISVLIVEKRWLSCIEHLYFPIRPPILLETSWPDIWYHNWKV